MLLRKVGGPRVLEPLAQRPLQLEQARPADRGHLHHVQPQPPRFGLQARPGMTGLWQVAGRSDLTFDDLVRLDFYYLENWSIWLDVSILIRTPVAVLARKGAY